MYYKILSDNKIHNGFKYKKGLNIDPLPFNPTGTCKAGGLYFTDIKNIFRYLDYGNLLATLEIPDDALVYHEEFKSKANKIKIKRIEKLSCDVVERLIKHGANIHADNNYALRWASEQGHLALVKFLLQHGADIHAGNNYVLRWASEQGHLALVKLLLQHGADIHADNDSALRWASGSGRLAIVKLLLQHGADIHADNDSALRWASWRGHLDIVKLLLQHGANIHADNNYALRWANINGHLAIVKYLTKYIKRKENK